MTSRAIVAVDPGERECGVVAVTPAPRGLVHVALACMVATTPEALDKILMWRAGDVSLDCVAIERARGFVFDKFRAPGLLQAQYVAGELAGLAHARGLRVVSCSREDWFGEVVGYVSAARRRLKGETEKAFEARRAKADARVADALEHRIAGGWNRANVHVRDALGLALFVAGRIWTPGMPDPREFEPRTREIAVDPRELRTHPRGVGA